MSITRTGNPTEVAFRVLTGARLAAARRDGDAILDGYVVELKFASGGAINQVRAVKYIPLVVHTGKDWYVIPPNEVVRLAARKKRGQHGENPFENAVFCLDEVAHRRVPESSLAAATLAAVREGHAWPGLQREMAAMLGACRAVTSTTRGNVSRILADGPSAAKALPAVCWQLSLDHTAGAA